MTPIDDLIHRLEAATGPDRGLDGAIAVASGQYDEHFQGRDGSRANEGWVSRNGGARVPAPRYTGSIDVAMTLVPSGWYAIITARGDGPHCVLQEFPQPCRRVPDQEPYVIRSRCTDVVAGSAIVICICALEARAATERTAGSVISTRETR